MGIAVAALVIALVWIGPRILEVTGARIVPVDRFLWGLVWGVIVVGIVVVAYFAKLAYDEGLLFWPQFG